VLDRAVAGDEVEQHAQAPLVSAGDEAGEVLLVAEDGVDPGVVADVVAEIRQRRGVDRAQPERVGAQPRQVVEALGHAAQVSDPVAVRVLERARVDLVDDGVAPPGGLIRIGRALQRGECP
jgi:hypothetical protein